MIEIGHSSLNMYYKEHFKALPAECLKWNNPPSIFEIAHYHYCNVKLRTL